MLIPPGVIVPKCKIFTRKIIEMPDDLVYYVLSTERRMIVRLRKKPWISEKIQDFADIIIAEPQQYKGRWQQYFNNRQPLHVEVGTGKGRFITTLAQLHPDINYIGVEYARDIVYYAALKARRVETANIRLLNFDVNNIVDVFSPGEVSRLYINFCDPWPKNRHAKRRLTHHDFLQRYKQMVVPGGEIHFKTDNEALFEFSLNEFCGDRSFQLQHISLDLHNSDFAGNVMTEYEEKFSSKGMKIFRLEAKYLVL
jgi:tRNA (guanine-N7-)-methyltransferase